MRSPRTTRVILLATALALLAVVSVPLASVAQTSLSSSLLVKLVDGLSPALQADVIARNGGVERSVIPALRLHVIDVPPSDLAAVRANYQADPRVVSVEENRTRVWEAVPADPLYPNQWALPRIAWDQVFGNVTPTGTARVALLDTGVDALHPDLAGKVVPGTSILDGSNGTTDPSGHGTWLAGIIAAQTDNVPVEGIAGVAYAGVTVLPVTVLNVNGEGQDSDVIAGVIWAADHGADVILMAFSNPGFSPNLQDAIDYAWSKGIVLVAAVGNGAVSDPTFPAGDRGVMGVAATDASDALAYFSNDGQAVFIAAPGVDIQTTDIGDAYVVVSGTSTSAAIVAGAAALMKAVDPTLTNGIIVGRLARNADPAGTQSQTGNGRINLARALADTSTEFVEPAGAAPVGAGGPFVGPYVAAAKTLTINFAGTSGGTISFSSLNPTGTVAACTATCGRSVDNNQQGTMTVAPNIDSVFAGWSGSTFGAGNSGTTTCTGTTSPCNFFMGTGGGSAQSITATFNLVAPTKLAITSVNGGTNPTAGTAFSVTVQSQAPAGTPSNVIANTGVTLSLKTGTGTLSGTLSGTIPAGGNSVTISGVIYSKAESGVVLTAARTSGDNLASGDSAPFTANPGAATKLAFITAPFSIAINQCSPAITVQSQDAIGNPANVNPARTINLNSSSGGGFFSDSNCNTSIASTTIANNANTSPNVFYRDGTAGSPTLTAHDTRGTGALTDATQTEVINKRTTTTSVTLSLSTVDVNQPTTVNVTVTDSDNGPKSTPTGTLGIGVGVGSDLVTGTCTLAQTVLGTATCSVTVTPQVQPGTHTITATFSATSLHATSNDTRTLTVNARSTSTSVSLVPSTVDVNQTSTVNVTVTDTDANGTKVTPTGTVGISVGVGSDVVTGTCTLAQTVLGTATCSVTVKPVVQPGTHTVTATFSATNVHSTSTDTKTLTVNARSTSTSVSLAPSTVDVNQASTATVTVTDTDANGTKVTPTGTVGITVGVGSDVVTGTCTLTESVLGAATCSVIVKPVVQPGAHTVTATFSATNVHSTSTDAKTLTVNARSTSTSVGLAPSTVDVNQASIVTVTVTDTDANGTKVTPTGTVGVGVGVGSDLVAGTCTLAQTVLGTATCTVTVTPQVQPGTHTVTATFTATAVHSTSTDTKTLTVNARPTSTSVSLAPSTVDVNQPTTVTVTVMDTDANGTKVTPTGTVGISVGVGTDVVAGTCALAQTLLGTATCTVTMTPQVQPGTHTVTAMFGATAAHTGSSDTKTLTVNTRSTSTSVSLSPSTVDVNQASTVTVTVMDTDANGTKVTPTGTVGMSVGVGSDVVAGTCALAQTVLGTATCAVTVTPAQASGVHTVTATFSVTGVHTGSSDTKTLTVNTRSTSTSVSLTPATVVTGQSSTVAVTVSDTDLNGTKLTPTGTVGISVGVGTDVVAGTCTLTQTVLGTATCSVTVTPAHAPGTHTITATFTATDIHSGSTNTQTLTVSPADTTTVITSDLSAATKVGQAYAVQWSVSVNAPGAGTPTGNVTVSDGTNSCYAAVAVGQCSITSTTPGFPKTIKATYAGDTDFNTSFVTTTHVVDDPPVSVADAYQTLMNQTLTVYVPGVLYNDKDVDAGQSITTILVSGPSNASAFNLNPDGSFTYTPAFGFTGTDSFTYQATDGIFAGNTVTVTIEVLAPAAALVAENDAYSIVQGSALSVSAPGILGNDHGPSLAAALVGGPPAHASAFNLNADGSFTYTPAAGFTGVDTFFYRATSGLNSSDLAMVTVAVLPDATLQAVNDFYLTTGGSLDTAGSGLYGVLHNDGQSLSAAVVVAPLYGTLTLQGDGSFVYLAGQNFAGVDSFTYRALSGQSASNVAVATIRAPEVTVVAPAVTYNDNATITITVTFDGLGPAAGNISLTVDGTPQAGPSTLDTSGQAVFTLVSPPAKEAGYALVATYANAAYQGHSTATGTLVVHKATPIINWSNPQDITYGTALGATQLNATATFKNNTVPGTFTYTPAAGTVLNAGLGQTLHVAFAPTDTSNFDNASKDVPINVNKAPLTVTANDKTKTYGDADPGLDVSYSGFVNGDGPTALSGTLAFNFAGKPPTSYGPSAIVPVNAGTYAVRPSGLTSNNYDITFKGGTYTVNPAPLTITPDGGKSKFYGQTFTAFTGSVVGLKGSDQATVTYTSAGAPAAAGAGSYDITVDTVTFTVGSASNYAITKNTATNGLTVNKAPLTVTANDKTKTYGDPDPGFDVSYSGFVNGEGPGVLGGTPTYNFAGKPPTSYGPSTTVPTDAGTFAIRPSGLTSSNYDISFKGGTYTINKAASTTVVTFETGPYVYRGTTFTATAAVTGVGGLNQSVAVVYSGDCTNVTVDNGCTATATYAGDPNHLGSTDSKSITITKASSTTVVTFEAGPYVYRATAFTATATVTGVGGLNQSVAVVYSGDCTNVTVDNGCTATATYAGDPNHLGSTDSKSITITKASSTTVVTFEAGPYVYHATAFTATATVTGVGGLNQSVPVVYSGDCTNVTAANGCTATATYAGDTNHNGSSDSKSITITQAATSTTVVAGTTRGTYTATVSPVAPATSVPTGTVQFSIDNNPIGGPVALDGSGHATSIVLSTPETAGSHTISAVYSGDTNYKTSTGTLTDIASAVADDAYATLQSSTLVVGAPGVLLNDADADSGQTLQAFVTQPPAQGTLTLNTDGSFTYVPAAGGAGLGVFAFKYSVFDGVLYSPEATVTITVLEGNETPVALNDAYSVTTGGSITVAAAGGVLANDHGTTLTAAVLAGVRHGTLTPDLNGDGGFTYTPTPGFTGVDSFLYQASDGTHTSNVAMVTITVVAADNTNALDDYYLTDSAVSGNVLSNDHGLPPAAAVVTPPLYGTLTSFPGDGTFSYTPGLSFAGVDSFTYRATGGTNAGNLATVTLRHPDITVDAPPVTYGVDATVTVTVTIPGLGPAVGSVSLSAVNATVAAPTLPLDQNGQATFTITQPTAANSPHVLTATYTNPAYNGSSTGSGSLTVNKATPTINWANPADITYGTALSGTQLDATATFKNNQVAGTFTYTPAAGTVLSAGQNQTLHVTFTPTDTGNLNSASQDVSINVNKKLASVTPDAKTKTYGDADPTLTGTLSGFVASDNVIATYSRTAGETVAGSPYTISAALSPAGVLGNYNITYNTATLTINRKAASVTPDAKSKIYGYADPAVTGALSGFLAADAVTATYSRTAGESVAGSPYTISAVLSPAGVLGNYDITYNTANFTINRKAASVTPNVASKTYGDPDPTLTGTLSGFLAADAVTATYSRTAGETVAGSPYTISAILSPAGVLGNYTITYNTANFTINRKAASVTPNVASKTYGDPDPTLTGTLSGFLAADAVTAAYSRTAGETVAGSPYTISAILSPAGVLGNYTITYNSAPFTINKRLVSVTPNPNSKIYGDADPNPLTTGMLTNFVAGDNVTPAYSRTAGGTVAGSPYTISATLSPAAVLGNYTITYNTASFNITKATLNVTADNKAKVLNAPNPSLTATFTGFKNGETLATSGVTGSPTLTTTATTTSPVGSYLITAALGSLSAANYSFAFGTGALAVQYAAAGLTCNGEVGHQILQPINVDNTSVFKLGSTVPTKFRVCDANGVSIGIAGVVTAYGLISQVTDGSLTVDESQYSTTPDTAFRWDSSAQQWIFNQSTKNNPTLNKTNTRYYFRIFLNDGTYIDFQYGLK